MAHSTATPKTRVAVAASPAVVDSPSPRERRRSAGARSSPDTTIGVAAAAANRVVDPWNGPSPRSPRTNATIAPTVAPRTRRRPVRAAWIPTAVAPIATTRPARSGANHSAPTAVSSHEVRRDRPPANTRPAPAIPT